MGPGGSKKVREACRKNFLLFSCNMDSVVPSYDEKTIIPVSTPNKFIGIQSVTLRVNIARDL